MGIGEINDDAHGITTPRIFTPPLRELTPEHQTATRSSSSPKSFSTCIFSRGRNGC